MNETLKSKLLGMLTANEDDHETRLVLADLLEEIGEDDEAERHRAWRASKEWMVDFCDKHAEYTERRDGFGYPDLMEMLSEVKDDDEPVHIHVGDLEELMYAIYETQEFWPHWSILTGIAVDDAKRSQISFRCAC